MMAGISNTVFRDNIRGNRLIPVTDGIVSVVNTRAFQRLRYVRQMGMSSLVFPTAEHTRFAHSLGVYATARETFATLARRAQPLAIAFPAMRFDEDAEKEFCLAAMCHDLGHTAFSHALEGVLLPESFTSHEECTLAILTGDEDVSAAIGNDADLEAVVLMIKGNHPNRALSQLVSGLFDLDRCDYLERDCDNSGVQYGRYDFHWLLHALSVGLNRNDQPILLIDGPRGFDALRQFLSARRHMYRQVYNQPAIRAAQLLLKAIFRRISDIEVEPSLIKSCPPGLRSHLQRRQMSLGDFLETTDAEVIYMVRVMANESKDVVLRELCTRFVERRLPKAVLDSGKSHSPLEKLLGVSLRKEEVETGGALETAYLPLGMKEESDVLAECRSVARAALKGTSVPEDIADYLVDSETIGFRSDTQTDVTFDFRDAQVPLDDLKLESGPYQLPELTETFHLYRLFAPVEVREHLAQHIATFSAPGRGNSR